MTPHKNKSSENVSPKAGSGESMKDSMTESAANNDNKAIPSAEDYTNENGELDAEAFKKSYQKGPRKITNDHNRNSA